MGKFVHLRITDILGRVRLHNGVEMPYFGLGVFQSREGAEVRNAIQSSLDCGYRLIDTASFYGNEKGVGDAVRSSAIARSEIFITTKVWNSDQGYNATLRAFDRSMELLGLDYLDLYLIHWPVKGKFSDTWKALELLYAQGRVRAIGVSNFMRHHLDILLEKAMITPMVNQVEYHPFLVQQDLVEYCLNLNIHVQAWSPLMRGQMISVPLIKKLALDYGKSEAQIVLRWDLQNGILTIPKSANPNRIQGNSELFDFVLSDADMSAINSLDRGMRIGPDPDNFSF